MLNTEERFVAGAALVVLALVAVLGWAMWASWHQQADSITVRQTNNVQRFDDVESYHWNEGCIHIQREFSEVVACGAIVTIER